MFSQLNEICSQESNIHLPTLLKPPCLNINTSVWLQQSKISALQRPNEIYLSLFIVASGSSPARFSQFAELIIHDISSHLRHSRPAVYIVHMLCPFKVFQSVASVASLQQHVKCIVHAAAQVRRAAGHEQGAEPQRGGHCGPRWCTSGGIPRSDCTGWSWCDRGRSSPAE